ncbi:hypothetical protein [Shewanella kaireitica]|uniref:hypothetical protein n=1 Tax=Shewanella kaireitica TaxID=212021 RepID=UPI00200DCE48|nr:hypothetical protein [Shewanella kaireitica]MCL1093283.1 hypothetical protein [Shewanella kaireitica]
MIKDDIAKVDFPIGEQQLKDELEISGFDVTAKNGRLTINLGDLCRAQVEYDFAKARYVIHTRAIAALLSNGLILGLSIFSILHNKPFYGVILSLVIIGLFHILLQEIKVSRARDVVERYNREQRTNH